MKLRSKIDVRSTSAGTSTDAQNASQNGSSVSRPSSTTSSEATGRPPGPRAVRPRVGLFLYTPRIGGAERYVKDVLHGIDRKRFEPVLLVADWPDLHRFLEPERSGIETIPMRVAELGVRLRSRTAAAVPEPDGPATVTLGREIQPSAIRQVGRRVPGWHAVAPRVRSSSEIAFFLRNLAYLQPQLSTARLEALHVVNGGYPGATSALAAVVAARRAGIGARLMTVCSTAMPRAFPLAAEARIDRAVAAASQAVIVPGATPGAALVERRGFDRDQLVTIPWGVTRHPSGRSAEGMRAELHVPAGAVLVGTLANFTGAKGHHLLLDAFSRLAPIHPEAYLVLGGDGPKRREIQQLAATLPGAERVSFPGNLSSALDFCRALDVFVLASDIEGLPYVVLEAMSMSVPVIATDVGAMAEAVSDGETGLLIPPSDADSLTRALAELLDDRAKREAMRAATANRFADRFDVKQMLDSHQDLYLRLLDSVR